MLDLSSLEVLDVAKIAASVHDYTPGRCRVLWGSQALLDRIGMSSEEFVSIDPSSGSSFHEYLYERVQVLGERDDQIKTVFPNGEEYTSTWSSHPIKLLLAGDVGETTLCLTVHHEIPSDPKDGDPQFDDVAVSSNSIIMAFDPVTGAVEHKNSRAEEFYDAFFSSPEGLVLEDVLDSCIWGSDHDREEVEALCEHLISNNAQESEDVLESLDQVEVECRKQLAPWVENGEEDQNSDDEGLEGTVWHRVRFVGAHNHSTGRSSIVVHEFDITEMKQIQLDLLQAQKEQEHFLASISHELRQPLNGIVGMSEALLQNPQCSPQMGKTLQVMKAASLRLAGLVNDILDSAATKRSTLIVRADKVRLREVAEAVVAVNAAVVRDGVQVINDVPKDLPLVRGDAGRIDQILTNFLSNAIKFTEQGYIRLTAEAKDEEVVVRVEDTGMGIPEEKLPYVWQAYRQVRSAALKYGGTGLGLTLVKDLVEAQNGEVAVESTPGKGSTFSFTLPKASAQSPPEPEEEAGPPVQRMRRLSWQDQSGGVERGDGAHPRRGRRLSRTDGKEGPGGSRERLANSEVNGRVEILSVDDATCNHEVVEEALEPLGYVVTRCMSGEEALQLLRTRGVLPDLILLDCMMPSMSGYDMCEQLRADFPCNALPVIMVSARDKEEDVVRGLASGCNDYLAKPFGVQELTARIEVQLRLRALWHSELRRAMSKRQSLQVPPAVHQQVVSGSEGVQFHPSVAALVCDLQELLVGALDLPSARISAVIHALFNAFDAVVDDARATRVIDDAYVVFVGNERLEEAQGLNPRDGARETKDVEREREDVRGVLEVGRRLLKACAEVQEAHGVAAGGLRLRIGVSVGPVHSARIGVGRAYYSYFGQAVREAHAAAAEGHPQCIHCTQRVADVLSGDGHLVLYSSPARGPKTYLAKAGQYVKALMESKARGAGKDDKGANGAVGGGGEGEGGSEEEESKRKHLKAFQRLVGDGRGEASEAAKGGGEGGGGPEEAEEACWRCLQLQELLTKAKEEVASVRKEVQRHSESRPDVGDAGSPLRSNGWGSEGSMLQRRETDPHDVVILSVDDDPVNQLVIQELLQPEGYQVKACLNGVEALQFLKQSSDPPDLILLDSMMPKMSGLEVCAAVRHQWSRTQLPIIMVSAKSAADNIVEGLKAGCNDYVSKPFSRVELLARISTQLRVKDAWRAELENARSTKLLQRMLPEHVIPKLRDNPALIVEEHSEVSILFADIVGFTTLAASIPNMELLDLLNNFFVEFDEICDHHGCYKVQTIGDAYMASAGHDGRTEGHAKRMMNMALDMVDAVRKISLPRQTDAHLRVRIGIHTGKALAGVIGRKMPRYCFFGDTVNTASRMESNGFPMCVHVSEDTMQRLAADFDFEKIGSRQIKGKGVMTTYVVKDDRCPWQEAVDKAHEEQRAKTAADASSPHSMDARGRRALLSPMGSPRRFTDSPLPPGRGLASRDVSCEPAPLPSERPFCAWCHESAGRERASAAELRDVLAQHSALLHDYSSLVQANPRSSSPAAAAAASVEPAAPANQWSNTTVNTPAAPDPVTPQVEAGGEQAVDGTGGGRRNGMDDLLMSYLFERDELSSLFLQQCRSLRGSAVPQLRSPDRAAVAAALAQPRRSSSDPRAWTQPDQRPDNASSDVSPWGAVVSQ